MENRTLGPTKSIPPCSKNLELVFWVLNGTAGVIILSGNFITILVLVTNRRLRQNYVNIFLVNLAVADLMIDYSEAGSMSDKQKQEKLEIA